MNLLFDLLHTALEVNASDLFVTATKRPSCRIKGDVRLLTEVSPVSISDFDNFRQEVLGAESEALYQKRGSYDTSLTLDSGERFRLNFFATLSGPALVARPLRDGGELFSDTLGLPAVIPDLCANPRGLILVVGSTGSGKSTTLAAMVNQINRTAQKHILTLEDPIEFLHHDINSLISQREIHRHAESFIDALRSGLRENPDVIVIGEMRDVETVSVALHAALTGHLVIATVHTANAVQTVERIISLFPAEQRASAAADLSLSLIAVLAQRLIPSAKTDAMVPAVEVLLNTSTTRKLIEECNYAMLDEVLRQSTVPGMQTFCREIFRLYQAGEISMEDARHTVDNVDEFDLLLHGMETGSSAFRYHYGTKGEGNDEETLDMSDLLTLASRQRASDLALTTNKPPVLRINGEWCPVDLPPLSDLDVNRLVFSVVNQRQRALLEESRELDFSLSVNLQQESGEIASSRFRVNAFFQRGSLGAVFRVISSNVPEPEKLGVPPRVLELLTKKQGLVLVVGPTGSGKSTTLASLIGRVNHTRPAHIVTIEDPIEFTFANDVALIEQREVSSDTLSFSEALKHAMRQAPDIILVGEMRDTETMAAALTAAETGHLVFATIHTNNAAQTVDRIIDSFPAGHQNQIRQQLASALLAILSQRLLPRADGRGRIAAYEVLVATSPVRALIRDNKSFQIQSTIETSQKDGMMTLEYYMTALLQRGLITEKVLEDYLSENRKDERG